MEQEIWRPIKSLHNMYEASSIGRIRTTKTQHIKTLAYDGRYLKFGYYYTYENQIYHGWYRVHRAIAETFIPNPQNKRTVNHINGDRKNNCVSNLEWATPKEQSIHARDVLHTNCGENHYLAKHTNDDVKLMRKLYESGVSIKDLATQFNDNSKNIRRIVKYERWKNI